MPFFYQLLKIIGLTCIIWGIFFLLKQFEATRGFVHVQINVIIIYSALVALIVALFNLFIMLRKGSHTAMVLGSTTIRMLLSILIMALLLIGDSENKLLLAVNFFIVYLFYLIFEIYSIITNLRRISKKGNS